MPTPLDGWRTPFYFGGFEVPFDNPMTVEGRELGRMLFYEKRLSANDQISCGTCHRQERAFTDGRRLARGIDDRRSERNTMSLANLLWGPQRFFWDGRAESLEAQAGQPILNPDEMGSTWGDVIKKLEDTDDYPAKFEAAFGTREITATRISRALATFERTLVSHQSKYDRYLRGETTLSVREQQGRQLFMTHPDVAAGIRGANCVDCHSQFLTSGFRPDFDGFRNNGLDAAHQPGAGLEHVTGDELDRGKFKTPTLRNIELTAPYMHDGRFTTLDEVIDHYDEHIKPSETLDPLIREARNEAQNAPRDSPSLSLTDEEKDALVAFLRTLTDHEFISNEEFTDPHR
ncbi:MAG: cytochrome c peroxidase [Myxococcota bacterium]